MFAFVMSSSALTPITGQFFYLVLLKRLENVTAVRLENFPQVEVKQKKYLKTTILTCYFRIHQPLRGKTKKGMENCRFKKAQKK